MKKSLAPFLETMKNSPEKIRFLCRADAYPEIGTGDLLSLIYLTELLEDFCEPFFLTRDTESARRVLQSRAKRARFFNPDFSLGQELEIISQTCRSERTQILFMEITHRPLEDYQPLPDYVMKACVNFDGKVPHDYHFILDWSIDASLRLRPDNFPGSTLITGPEYVLLDPRVGNLPVRNPDADKVLISMGGADEFDLTNQILTILAEQNPTFLKDLTIQVIAGPGYRQHTKLQSMAESLNCGVEIHDNISFLPDLFSDAHVVISAGGLTASELAATQTPNILISTYDHQVARCRYFHEKGWSYYLGHKCIPRQEFLRILKDPHRPSNPLRSKTSELVDQLKSTWRDHEKHRTN